MCLEVPGPTAAAHLGDGGEGLLVLRAGDRQQRVGHRDQACRYMLTLCDANTAFQNPARPPAYGICVKFCFGHFIQTAEFF